MSQTFLDTTPTLAIGVAHGSRLLGRAARAAAELRARLALARQRSVVRALDDAQLADAGIDASTIVPPRPTIAIEAGLMTTLMAMR